MFSNSQIRLRNTSTSFSLDTYGRYGHRVARQFSQSAEAGSHSELRVVRTLITLSVSFLRELTKSQVGRIV